MSKAFVKEDASDDGADLDRAHEPAPRGPQYISAAGRKVLLAELNRLWKDERPRVTREVEAAAALGDRSENAEYIYGKKRLREIDRRLRFLKGKLETLIVVAERPAELGKVFFGAQVTLQGEDGAEVTYRLVGGDEIDLAKRCISVDSPIGKALLGKEVGDVVTVKRPKGDVELEIVKIRYGAPG
ncbi:MAG: transcription elongation factor GreB [Deltaproteobacteria bacterium]|nr:transcription elongation factor GreB [Deltaproteobacteria bacterium]